MTPVDPVHLAALRGVEAFLWLLAAVLVLSGLTLLVAWANDRIQRRGADEGDERPRFDPEHLQD